jgi:hypothetical protein
MSLFGSSQPLERFKTAGMDPRDAAPSELARFVTTPLVTAARYLVASDANLRTSHLLASASSKPMASDGPTLAVPLAALLAEAQDDILWVDTRDRKVAPEAAEQELSLYRLAIDASNLTYEQAYSVLALTVEYFHKGDHVERIEQPALRTAAGVLLRVQKHVHDDPVRILAPFYINQLRSIVQSWHLYRELVKAIDNRSDFLVRMRRRADRLIIGSLFSEEGRVQIATRIAGFIESCQRLQLDSEPLKRAEWLGKLLVYRTDEQTWQVPPEACIALCTRLLREISDDLVMGALRRLALTAWEGLCVETNHLRDIFTDVTPEDRAQGIVLLHAEVPSVGLAVPDVGVVPYFPDQNSFHKAARAKRDREKVHDLRLVI